MAARNEVYKCEKCGLIATVMFEDGAGALSCCDTEMVLMVEGTVDASKETHVPVIEKTANGYKVKVGSKPHPMLDAHWITWIEILADGKALH